jgi:hypothetical protein
MLSTLHNEPSAIYAPSLVMKPSRSKDVGEDVLYQLLVIIVVLWMATLV